jgi:hypothetical protein
MNLHEMFPSTYLKKEDGSSRFRVGEFCPRTSL